MLYVPWRDESSYLLGGYMDFHSHYEDKKDDILKNEQKFTQNATEIDEAIDDLTEHGPPQHAWDQVAPGGAAHERTKHQAENGCELSQKMVQGCSCNEGQAINPYRVWWLIRATSFNCDSTLESHFHSKSKILPF